MFSISIKSVWTKTIFAVLLGVQVQAQLLQTDRYEMLLYSQQADDAPNVTVLDQEGVLIYRRVYAKVSDRIEITKLDTTLNTNWRGYINIEKASRISLVKSFENNTYFLLRSAVYGNFDFTVIAMASNSGEFITYKIRNIIPFTPSEFVITNQAILIGGYFNFRPVVIHFSFATGKSKLLPGFFNEPGEITQLSHLKNGAINVIVSGKNIQRKKVLWLRNYTAEGDLIRITQLEPDAGKSLIYAKSITFSDDTQLVVGVYGATHPEYGRGIFTARIEQDGYYKMEYKAFSELENFFGFMKVKREKRLKDRIARRLAQGKQTNKSYRFLVHELIPYENQILLLGESFYPRYIYANPYGYYGVGVAGSIVRGDRIFDGYRYTHASIISMNEKGKFNWDNSFEINDIKIYTLEQFVKLIPVQDNLELVYVFDNVLRTKTIHTNKVIEDKKEIPLKVKYDTDQVRDKSTESSTLNYWYNQHLIAYGIQTVREIVPGKGTQERKVLFINKLKYQ
jgi:hypothetical protein